MEDKSQNRLPESFVMNGGEGPNSYAKNSVYQRGITDAVKILINEEITKNLDIQQLQFAKSKPLITIADLGCSCGPNTILAMENIMEAVNCKFQAHGLINPEFQVFFNDQVRNDFNSLFASLPVERKYCAAGVPGSFHGHLFPTASLHTVYSSCAVHFLSKLPNPLLDKTSPAWNPGRIYYTGAPKEVYEAYADQFAEDIDLFLNARLKELVPGGLMALNILAIPDVMTHPKITMASEFELVGSCLMDMAKMGTVSEAQVDTFNVPMYYPCPRELEQIITKNGCFSIKRMEIINFPQQHIATPDLKQRTSYLRAILEGLIEKHFGDEIIDELFDIYSKKLSKSSIFLNPEDYQQAIALFLLLKPNVK